MRDDIKTIKYFVILIAFILLAILFVLTLPTLVEGLKHTESERLLAEVMKWHIV